jgi:hypothetical protein
MITAIEAKIAAARTKPYYNIVNQKIKVAANNGNSMCAIQLDEIPNATTGTLYEISNLLYELGYRTLITHPNTLTIYWHVKSPTYYNIDDFDIIEE